MVIKLLIILQTTYFGWNYLILQTEIYRNLIQMDTIYKLSNGLGNALALEGNKTVV